MKKFSIVGVYSVIHCIVDMACAMLIAGLVTPHISSAGQLMIAILLYNMFAFAFQLPFGIMADKLDKNAVVSAVGCGFIILGYVINPLGIVACVMAGIGNALFHVGGGIDVLNIAEKRASLPGVYVATGALGLYIGSKSPALGFTNYYVMMIVLFVSVLALLWLYRQAKNKYNIHNEKTDLSEVFEDDIKDGKAGCTHFVQKKQFIMLCFLITIALRGYMGLILNFDWKTDFRTGLVCVLAVVLGKMLGGILGDKLGWRRVSVLSLAVSAVLFVPAFDNMICGIVALLLFNMTMPITLTALSNMYNHNKGMAFGLTTVALFVGALPVLLGYESIGFSQAGVCIMTVMSVIALYIGLRKYEKVER